jgi:hypothetical protein
MTSSLRNKLHRKTVYLSGDSNICESLCLVFIRNLVSVSNICLAILVLKIRCWVTNYHVCYSIAPLSYLCYIYTIILFWLAYHNMPDTACVYSMCMYFYTFLPEQTASFLAYPDAHVPQVSRSGASSESSTVHSAQFPGQAVVRNIDVIAFSDTNSSDRSYEGIHLVTRCGSFIISMNPSSEIHIHNWGICILYKILFFIFTKAIFVPVTGTIDWRNTEHFLFLFPLLILWICS